MKNRLHDKKAGVAILLALIVISLAEMIFRGTAMGLKAILTTANFGEQLAVLALAVTILVLTAKGKDRACYICYGAWIGYFALDQLFELPGVIIGIINQMAQAETIPVVIVAGAIMRILSMVGIVAIGVLLVEYMTDGTIYNKAFSPVGLPEPLVDGVVWTSAALRYYCPVTGLEICHQPSACLRASLVLALCNFP